MKIFIIGRSGRMGQLVENSATEHHHTVVGGISLTENNFSDVDPDIIIDFSSPELLLQVLPKLRERKIPLISGTTGLSEGQLLELQRASEFFPIMHATNFALGVNVLFKLAEIGAKALKGKSEIEIVEKHHRYKKDAPSGTAVTIGEIVAKSFGTTLSKKQMDGRSGIDNERKDEIAFHALRGGNIIGEHSLQFIMENELLEVRHEALSRQIFADGAISAIPFISSKQNGFYHIQDTLNL